MSSVTSVKRVPKRTCVACQTTSGKREFIRVVKTPEGQVAVDPTSKANGRGAYVCARAACWEQALAKDRLARALRTSLAPDDKEALRRFAEQFEFATAEVES